MRPFALSSLTRKFTALLTLIVPLVYWCAGARGAETPKPGGELVFAVGGTPPSYDGHRETTFAMLHPVAPHYADRSSTKRPVIQSRPANLRILGILPG